MMESNGITRLISTAEDLNDLLIIENYFEKHPFSPISSNKVTIDDLQRLFDSALNNIVPNNNHMRGLLGIVKCLRHFSFCKDEALWHSMNECFVNLLYKCTGYLMMNSETEDKLFKEILQHLLETIIESSKHHKPVKNGMLLLLSPLLFDAIINKNLPLMLKKQCITSLTCLVTRTDQDIRKNVMELVYPNLVKFFDQLYTCGDFDTQLCIVETILRYIVPDKNRKIFFVHFKHKSPDVIKYFLSIRSKDFDVDCRVFLNYINKSQGENALVVSIPCYTILLDDSTIEKPPEQELFWVDFNRGAPSVSFWCTKTSLLRSEELTMTELASVTDWQLVVIKPEVVSEVKFKSVRSRNDDQRSFKELQFIIEGKLEIKPLEGIASSYCKLVRMIFPKSSESETLEHKILPTLFKMKKLDDCNSDKKRKVSFSAICHFSDGFSTIDSVKLDTHTSSNPIKYNKYQPFGKSGSALPRKIHIAADNNCVQSSDKDLNGSKIQEKKRQVQNNDLTEKCQLNIREKKTSITKTQIEFQSFLNTDDENKNVCKSTSSCHSSNVKSLNQVSGNHLEKKRDIVTNEELWKEDKKQSKNMNQCQKIFNTVQNPLHEENEVSSANNFALKIIPNLESQKIFENNLNQIPSFNELEKGDDVVKPIHKNDQKETKEGTSCVNDHLFQSEMGKDKETPVENRRGNTESQRLTFPDESLSVEKQLINKNNNKKHSKYDIKHWIEPQESKSNSVPLTKRISKDQSNPRKQSLQITTSTRKRKMDGDNIYHSEKRVKRKQSHLNEEEEVLKGHSNTRRSARIQNARTCLEKVDNKHLSKVNYNVNSEYTSNNGGEVSESEDFKKCCRKKQFSKLKTKPSIKTVCVSHDSEKSSDKTLEKQINEGNEEVDETSELKDLKKESMEKRNIAIYEGNIALKLQDKNKRWLDRTLEKSIDSVNVNTASRRKKNSIIVESNDKLILDAALSNNVLETLSPIKSNKKNDIGSNINGFPYRDTAHIVNNDEIKNMNLEKQYLETNNTEIKNKDSKSSQIKRSNSKDDDHDNVKEGEKHDKENSTSTEKEKSVSQQNNKLNMCGKKIIEQKISPHHEEKSEKKLISNLNKELSKDVTCIPESVVISGDEINKLSLQNKNIPSNNVSQNASITKIHFSEKTITKSPQSPGDITRVITKAIVHAPSKHTSPEDKCNRNTFISQSIKVFNFFSQNITSVEKREGKTLDEKNCNESNMSIVNSCINDRVRTMCVQEMITNDINPDKCKSLNKMTELIEDNSGRNNKLKRKNSHSLNKKINKEFVTSQNKDILVKANKISKASCSPNKTDYKSSIKQLANKKNSSSRSIRKRKSVNKDSRYRENKTLVNDANGNKSETSDLNKTTKNSVKKKLFTQNQQDVLNLCSGSQSSNAGENNDPPIVKEVAIVPTSSSDKVSRNKIYDEFDKLLITSPPPFVKRNPNHWEEKYRKEIQRKSVKCNSNNHKILSSKRKIHSVYSDFDSDTGTSVCKDNGYQSQLTDLVNKVEIQTKFVETKSKSEITCDKKNLKYKMNKENCVKYFNKINHIKEDSNKNICNTKLNETPNLENLTRKKLKRYKQAISHKQSKTDSIDCEHKDLCESSQNLMVEVKGDNNQQFEKIHNDQIQKSTRTTSRTGKIFKRKNSLLNFQGGNEPTINKQCDHSDVHDIDKIVVVVPEREISPTTTVNPNGRISDTVKKTTDLKDLCFTSEANLIQINTNENSKSLESLVIHEDKSNQEIENKEEADIQISNKCKINELKCYEIQHLNWTETTKSVGIIENQDFQTQSLRKTDLNYSVSNDALQTNNSHIDITEKFSVKNTKSCLENLTDNMRYNNLHGTINNTQVIQCYSGKECNAIELQQNAKSTLKTSKSKICRRQCNKENKDPQSYSMKSDKSNKIMNSKNMDPEDYSLKYNLNKMSLIHENTSSYDAETTAKEMSEFQNIFHDKPISDCDSKNKTKSCDNMSLENDLLNIKTHFSLSSPASNVRFKLQSENEVKSKELITNSSYNMQEVTDYNSLEISLSGRSPDQDNSSKSSLEIKESSEESGKEEEEENYDIEGDKLESSAVSVQKKEVIISSVLTNFFQKSIGEKLKYVKEFSGNVSNTVLNCFSKSSSSYLSGRSTTLQCFDDIVSVNLDKIEEGIKKMDDYAVNLEKTFDEIKMVITNKNEIENEIQQSFSHIEEAYEKFPSDASCEQKFEIQQLISSLDKKYKKETLRNMLEKLHNMYEVSHQL